MISIERDDLMSVAYDIERLLHFGLSKGLIRPEDVMPVRNGLMDLLGVKEPYSFADDEIMEGECETAAPILAGLLDACVASGLIPDDTATQRDLMDARIMGLLMPRASEVSRRFGQLYAEDPVAATDYFYALSRDSHYIQVDRIAKNLYWQTATEFGALEITINLSKPEKDPKEIAAAKSMPQTNYPKCLLCAENEGFAGHMNHPARQNLRLIPLPLAGRRWYMQYSPYVYYNEHCIVLNSEHVPMKITESAFQRLLDFVAYLPHYFIGSNADIPIVGGSILTHDHYQGGRHVFPMEMAAPYGFYCHRDFDDVQASLVKWPMSVIRIASAHREKLVALAMHILRSWQGYEDCGAEVIPFTGETPHNAITPIARQNKAGLFEMDLVLRNNRTSDGHPMGIFHPHEELHHIKKENIGLIEVMGLAVLPGRLDGELRDIAAILAGKSAWSPGQIAGDEAHPLHKHLDWIGRLIERYGLDNREDNAVQIVRDEVGLIFTQVLADAGVFKWTEQGRAQFDRFMQVAGFSRI